MGATLGMQLWDCGGIDWRPGIQQAGICRVVIIDLGKQAIVRQGRYPGIGREPQALLHGQGEVTWHEGGGVRIIGEEAAQRWKWSHQFDSWEQGGCPPDEIIQAILAAMGKVI